MSVDSPSTPHSGSDGFDLRVIADSLRKRKWMIIGLASSCALAAAVVCATLPRQYESLAVVLVRPTKIGDIQQPLSVSTAAYRPLFEGQAVAAAVIGELRLAQPPHGLTVGSFRSRLQVEEVANTNLMRIRLRLDDPELAARALNRLATLAIEKNRRINQEEAAGARDFIQRQLTDAAQKRDTLESQLIALKREKQIDLLRRDAQSVIDERAALSDLAVRLETERARVMQAEHELAIRERIVDVRRRPASTAALLSFEQENARAQATPPRPSGPTPLAAADTAEVGRPRRHDQRLQPDRPPDEAEPLTRLDATRSTRGADDAEPDGVPDLSGEFINPVYELLEYQVANGRTRISALERQRDELAKRLKVDRGYVQRLSDLYRSEIEIATLEDQYELATEIYNELVKRYENARIQVASRSSEVYLVDAAVPIHRPVSPRLVRSVILAALSGLIIGALAALLTDVFGNRRESI